MKAKAIYVLWIRQLKRYLRSRVRIVSSLTQSILFLVALDFGFGPIFQKAGGGNYLNFIAPGIIAMAILFPSVSTGIEIIWDRQFGFLKETLVAPISRLDIMIGKTLGNATVAIMQGIAVFILSIIFGFRPANVLTIPVAIGFMALIAIIFTAFGTAIASRLEDMQGFHFISNFVIMPLFFLSGALFPLQELPAGILTAAKFNPLAYGVDGLRGALIGQVHFGLGTDLIVLSLVAVVFLMIGSYSFSKIQF